MLFRSRWSGNGPPGPKIILLMDACLDELWGHELRGSVGSSLLRKLRSGEKPAAFSGVAMVYATGIMQQAMDAAEGTNSSPFAIALQNNMTVPGLTLAQFTSRVRDEVEQITSGFQTPTLLSATQMRDLVMVQPLATGRS